MVGRRLRHSAITLVRYVTHTNVAIDPAVPVDRWHLDPIGVERARALATQPWAPTVDRIISSDEVKAVETSQIVAAELGLTVDVRAELGEHDRSATGYLPPDEFEPLVDRFFARPTESVRGWERALDAQRRIVDGLADLLEPSTARNTVVVGHGGVGTLWYCWLTDRAISRAHDQPGQGHYFTVDTTTRTVLHAWRPVDPRG